MALALDSGQPVEYWRDQCDPRDLDTALAIRAQQARAMEEARTRRR